MGPFFCHLPFSRRDGRLTLLERKTPTARAEYCDSAFAPRLGNPAFPKRICFPRVSQASGIGISTLKQDCSHSLQEGRYYKPNFEATIGFYFSQRFLFLKVLRCALRLVVLHVKDAHDVKAMDTLGTSDPFCIITCDAILFLARIFF